MDQANNPLTPKDIDILRHVSEGMPNKRIAYILGIKEQTVKNRISTILLKLNANSRAHAVVLAVRNAWISTRIKSTKAITPYK
jgi:DNA-binding NarL/FixJ family response regulator